MCATTVAEVSNASVHDRAARDESRHLFFHENASKDAERVERTSFPALAALKERGRNKNNDAGESGDINSDDYDGEE